MTTTKVESRAAAIAFDGVILARVEVAASVDRVTAAMTDEVMSWWRAAGHAAATTVSHAVDAIDGGARVTVRHAGFDPATGAAIEACRAGWQRVLGTLAAQLAAPDTRLTFLCRLIGPRPTFMTDMTADERAVMGAHGAYWRGKLAAGAAVAFGPVADPAGGWGLGVVKAADRAELDAFTRDDPAMIANIGFRYETIPMVTVVY